MKTVKKIIYLALAVLLCTAAFSACFSYGDRFEKALMVDIETPNEYCFADEYGVMSGKAFFSYQDVMGLNMLNCGFSACADKVYFAGYGSQTGPNDYGQPTKAAIWSMDYRTGEAVLLKEIDTVTMPYGNGTVECFIEDRAMLRYGGKFEIFDMKNKRTLYEESDGVGYLMNNTYILNNHYGVKAANNIFWFYENCGENYRLYTFNVENLWDMSKVLLIDDVIYFLQTYDNQGFGVNYKTNEIIPVEELPTAVLSQLTDNDVNNAFSAGGESFVCSQYKNDSDKFAPYGLTIERTRDGVKRFIGCEYLYNKSAAYKKITDIWKSGATAYNYSFQPDAVFVVNDKVIISCKAYYPRQGMGAGYESPLYFVEYDFNEETVLYAGSGAYGRREGPISKIIKIN